MSAQETIAIIAGRGSFPSLVARAAKNAGMRAAIAGFKGFTDQDLVRDADQWKLLHMGRLSQLIAYLKSTGATRVCMAGAIDKPQALSLRPDLRALKVLMRMRGKGDDALLRALINELETEGFSVVQAADLAPSLRAPHGVLSSREPSSQEWSDLRFGWAAAKRMGELDIGQCVVVRDGVIVAVEAMEGTDQTLQRAGQVAGPGCVVVKTVKPGQEERVDLPALGKTTIESLIQAKAACLGFEAGKTLFFDLDESIRLADSANICLIGLTQEDIGLSS